MHPDARPIRILGKADGRLLFGFIPNGTDLNPFIFEKNLICQAVGRIPTHDYNQTHLTDELPDFPAEDRPNYHDCLTLFLL
jgi:hypothetical protein